MRYTHDNVTYDTGSFTVTVTCAAIAVTAIPAAWTYTVPDVTAALFVFVARNTYVADTAPACPVTYLLYDSPAATATVQTWLTVATNGDLSVDINKWEAATVMVRYTYDGSTADHNAFSVTVSCPTLTATTLATTAYNYVVPMVPSNVL